MVPRTISCISVGTLLRPCRPVPYNTPYTHPRRKRTRTYKQKTNFFYALLEQLCIRKGEISKKKTWASQPVLQAFRPGLRMFDNVFVLLQLNSCLRYQHSCTPCWCVVKWPFNRLSTSSLTGTINFAQHFFPDVFSFLVQKLTHGLFFRYLAHKVDLLTNEHRLVMIIHLLRGQFN